MQLAAAAVLSLCLALPSVAADADEDDAAQAKPVANSNLDAEGFFDVSMGLLYLTQKDAASAHQYLRRAAEYTGDERLYSYAIESAWAARAPRDAQRTAQQWLQDAPDSIRAAKTLVEVSIASKRYRDSVEPMRQLIAGVPSDKSGAVLLFSTRYYERAASEQELGAVKAYRKAIESYLAAPTNKKTQASAHAAMARLYWLAQEDDEAVEYLEKAHTLAPRSDHFALVAMEMASQGSEPATTLLRLYMRDNPNVPADIGLQYARLLISKRSVKPAITQIKKIIRAEPEYAEAWFVLAVLQEDTDDLDQAKQSAQKFLDLAEKASQLKQEDEQVKDEEKEASKLYTLTEQEPPTAKQVAQMQLLLAGIAVKQNRPSEAEEWLRQVDVDTPAARLSVIEQRVLLLEKQGRTQEALALVEDLSNSPKSSTQALQAQVDLYSVLKEYALAYNASIKLLEKQPDNIAVQYDHAILAERIERYDEMERFFRDIIKAEPEQHDAYNALGYSFAERGVKLDEAYTLVRKALDLAPGNVYVTDSLAWVLYKQGKTAEALALLEEVFDEAVDPEIAAHYGELLHVSGQESKAREIWNTAYGTTKGKKNTALKETMERFGVLK